MQREILFRGKRKDFGEWAYGYFFKHPDGSSSIFVPGEGSYIVDPETVGQYTGLTDKNGVRLFEGDIIEWHFDCGIQPEREQVANSLDWDRGLSDNAPFMSAWGSTCGRYYKTFMNVFDPNRYAVIVGNIHTNPPLN